MGVGPDRRRFQPGLFLIRPPRQERFQLTELRRGVSTILKNQKPSRAAGRPLAGSLANRLTHVDSCSIRQQIAECRHAGCT